MAKGRQHGDWLFPARTDQDQVYRWDGNPHTRHSGINGRKPHTASAGTCSPNPVPSSGVTLSYLWTPFGCPLRTRPQGPRRTTVERKRGLEGHRCRLGFCCIWRGALLGTDTYSCRALTGGVCHQGAVPTLSGPPHTCFSCNTVLSHTCY